MRKIPKPDFSVSDVLAAASSYVKNAGLKAKLGTQRVKDRLAAAEHEYDNAAKANRIYTLPTSHDVAGILDENESIGIYGRLRSLKIADKNAVTSIFKLACLSKCGYCNHDTPTQLDHYLPKTSFAEYAFCPINLVPSCSHCNSSGKKGTHVPTSHLDVLFHPYYDDPDDEKWLSVDMSVGTTGLIVKYRAVKPLRWSDSKFKKIKFTFDKLGLSEVYSVDLQANLASLKVALQGLYDTGNIQNLMDHFQMLANNMLSTYKNNWIGVGYEYIASNRQLCLDFPKWFP